MAKAGVPLSLDAHRRAGNAVRYVERLQAEGVTDSRGVRRPTGTHFRVAIAASPTRDGTKWRWTYTATPKIKTLAGFGGWADDPRFSAAITLRNTFERDNDATGVVSGYELDNGVNETRVTGIEPIEAGLIVEAWAELFIATGTLNVEWWFSERNIPIITCPEAA
jgi:hypothetical protein